MVKGLRRVLRVLLAAVAAAVVVFGSSLAASAMGIHPFVIDVEACPAETARFELSISSDGNSDHVGLRIYGIRQSRYGDLEYIPAAQAPCSSWVRLPTLVDIPNSAQRTIEGQVLVPADAGGSYHLAIMVEPQTKESGYAVAVRVRYAVRLNIRVPRAGLRADAKVKSIGLAKAESGEPVVEAIISNTSPVDYLASAEVTIRDSSMRLLERVELRPQSGWSNGWTQSRLYPHAEVAFLGFPRTVLAPGEYDLRLFLRYASGRQLISTAKVKVAEGSFVYPERTLVGVSISPDRLDFTLAPGGAASKAVRFGNTGSVPVRVLMQPRQPEPGYPRSIGAQGDLELRGGADFVLQPGRSATRVVGLQFPKDSPPGGYYGAIDVAVVSLSGELLHTEAIQADAHVGQGWKRSIEIAGGTLQADEDGYLVGVVVMNTGDVALSPWGQGVIRAADGSVAASVKLEVEGDAGARVLPGRDITVVGLANHLVSGSYTVEVVVGEGSTSLGIGEFQVLIPSEYEGTAGT